jgi:tyrosyl-tRNA synthetase
MGFRITILLADVHSYLDQGISTYNFTEERTIFYEHVLKSMLKLLNVKEDQVTFVRGSEYQLDKRYCIDLLKLTSVVRVKDAEKASSEVVKKEKNPLLSHLLYPLLQALDESYLEADVELCGVDQLKILAFSRNHIELIGYKKCSYFVTPLIPALKGGKKKKINTNNDNEEKSLGEKMSSSDPNSEISFLDFDEIIKDKIAKAFCDENSSDCDDNSLLSILKHIIFPFYNCFDTYGSWEDFRMAWQKKQISVKKFKILMGNAVCEMVKPVRQDIYDNIEIFNSAYKNEKKTN